MSDPLAGADSARGGDVSAADAELMAAVAAGDPEAFAVLVQRHMPAAWRLAWRLTGEHAAADDLVQDAFLRVLRTADRYRPTAAFSTWLHRIVTNLAIDRTRRRAVRRGEGADASAVLAALPAATAAPADALLKSERSRAIATALAELPADQRAAVVLRYGEGLDARRMATVLDRSPKAVERMLARARAKLAPRLRHLIEEPERGKADGGALNGGSP